MATGEVFVIGGYFDNSGEGFVYKIDVFNAVKSKIVSFTPQEDLRVPRKGFTGAAWIGKPQHSDLLVCGFSAIYRFSPPNWKLSGVLHQKCMNDLHSVNIHNNLIFIANTGLETIDVFNLEGLFIGSYSLQPGWLNKERQSDVTPTKENWKELLNIGWQTKSTVIDNQPLTDVYYKTSKTNFYQKPVKDFIHLNHVVATPTQILATSLSNKCIYNVCNFDKIIETPSPPHDGFINEGKFWITCVEGQILSYEIKNNVVSNTIIDCFNIFDHIDVSGWCRGIMIQKNYLFIGITEIRRKPQYDWNVSAWENTKTGIICWDLSQQKLIKFIDLSEERHSKIFTILRA